MSKNSVKRLSPSEHAQLRWACHVAADTFRADAAQLRRQALFADPAERERYERLADQFDRQTMQAEELVQELDASDGIQLVNA